MLTIISLGYFSTSHYLLLLDVLLTTPHLPDLSVYFPRTFDYFGDRRFGLNFFMTVVAMFRGWSAGRLLYFSFTIPPRSFPYFTLSAADSALTEMVGGRY